MSTSKKNPKHRDTSSSILDEARKALDVGAETRALSDLMSGKDKMSELMNEGRRFSDLMAQAQKGLNVTAMVGKWGDIAAEARKAMQFHDLSDLTKQLAAHTIYLDPSQFRSPSISDTFAKQLAATNFAAPSFLESQLNHIYLTDRERELQKEIGELRDALVTRKKALAKEKAGAEAQKAAALELESTLKELRQKEALSYILSRLHQDAGRVIMSSEALQGQFRDDQPHAAFVMSVDIRRSTDLMLKARNARLFASFITGLCNVLKEIVIAHHGVFDKFTGDGILAFFPLFYTGDEAGLRCVLAAADCHAAFAAHYDRHRGTFIAVAKNVGLGVGIDFGDVHFVEVADGLTVVGTPVVYACRMGGTAAGTTLLNHPAYEVIAAKHAEHCEFAEVEFEIKHEGPVAAYRVLPTDKRFELPEPAWKAYDK
jgi:class 3 adenylate cyclase